MCIGLRLTLATPRLLSTCRISQTVNLAVGTATSPPSQVKSSIEGNVRRCPRNPYPVLLFGVVVQGAILIRDPIERCCHVSIVRYTRPLSIRTSAFVSAARSLPGWTFLQRRLSEPSQISYSLGVP